MNSVAEPLPPRVDEVTTVGWCEAALNGPNSVPVFITSSPRGHIAGLSANRFACTQAGRSSDPINQERS